MSYSYVQPVYQTKGSGSPQRPCVWNQGPKSYGTCNLQLVIITVSIVDNFFASATLFDDLLKAMHVEHITTLGNASLKESTSTDKVYHRHEDGVNQRIS